jgi:uncharacterized membrane protein YgcG
MNNPTRRLTTAGTAVLLGLYLFNPALAADAPGDGQVPLKTMTQAEYEIYRQQLDRQVKNVTSNQPKQEPAADGKALVPSTESDPGQKEDKSDKSGYGKGYRARMGSGSTGGFRGGAMSRGGGRNH